MRWMGWVRGAIALSAASTYASACAEGPHEAPIQTDDRATPASGDAGGRHGDSGRPGSDAALERSDAALPNASPDIPLTDASTVLVDPAAAGTGGAQTPASPADVVAHVIFDSDMSSDWDDIGDIAVLHGLASYGQIEILAMAVSSLNGGTAMCMDAINTYYGKPNIPIGVRPDVGGVGGYPAQIASEFPHGPEQAPKDFPLAVDVYRKVLAAQPDKSVTIVTTGYLTNLKALMLSGPDQNSPLTGRELVKRKVKLYSCAAGAFPSGDEFNFRASGDDSAAVVLNDWPSQVVYVGYEIGQPVQTAGRLVDTPTTNPIRRVYVDIEHQYPYPSWGQIAVYYAARPLEGLWGAVTVGHNMLDAPGHNEWLTDTDPTGDLEQSYLLEKVRSAPREALDALMVLPPNNGTASRPGDPSNLRATAAGANRVDLQWTDNAFNESGFTVERLSNGAYTPIGTVGANVSQFSDSAATSTVNVSYRVKATNAAGDSQFSTVWVYSGWTEVNFADPTNLPLYSYYQFSNLRWSRGGDFRPDHVALNNDSQHGRDVKIRVDVGALGSEGAFNVYLLYKDPNNWVRLTADGAKTSFQKRVGGTTTQIGASGPGINIGNGSALSSWLVESTAAGALKFSVNGASVLTASEPFSLTDGKIGLGASARTPVWENFRFETTP